MRTSLLLAWIAVATTATTARGQETARFDSELPLWVYGRDAQGEPVRLGTTPTGGQGVAVPASSEWFVRPILEVTVESVTRLAAEVKKKNIPGVSFRLPCFRSTTLPPGALAALADLPSLRSLELFNCTGLDERAWADLGRLRSLRRLEVQGAAVEDPQLAAITGLTELRELHIGGSVMMLTNAGLASIARLTSLEVLDLSRASSITAQGLEHLAALGRLRVLSLMGVRPLAAAGVAPLARLAALEELDLSFTDINDEALGVIVKGTPKLKRLRLDGAKLQGPGLAALEPLKALEELSLRSCEQLDDEALKRLANVRSLRMLELTRSQVTDAGVQALRGLTLRHLGLSINDAITDASLPALRGIETLEALMLGSTAITDAGLAALAGAPALRTLVVPGTQLGDGMVEHLAKLPALEGLDLSRCARLTDDGVARLGTLPLLKSVVLSDNAQLTGRGLEGLARAPIEELALEDCDGMQPAGLGGLGKFGRLRRVHLYKSKADDSTLAALGRCASLEELHLSNLEGHTTDAGLSHLRGLRGLRVLDLSGMDALTKAGLAHLEGLPIEELQLMGAWGQIDELALFRVVAPPRAAQIAAREGSPEENERQAIRALRRLAGMQSLFRESDKDNDGQLDYAESLEELAPLLEDPELAAGRRKGYAFCLVRSQEAPEFRWLATASPLDPGKDGRRHFAIDARGKVFESDTAFEASSTGEVQGGREVPR